MRFLTPEFKRYAVIGLISNCILYGVYVAFSNLFLIDPKISMTITYVLGMAIGFFMHKEITFRVKGHIKRLFLRFILSHCAAYGFNFLILLVFVDYFSFSHLVIQGIAIILVAVSFFCLMKYFVFKKMETSFAQKH